jgi:hypothetical protein
MKTRTWSIKKIKEGFENFYREHGHHPTAHEIDAYPGLPTSRSIQRSNGGLVTLRKQLNLGGQIDFTTGKHSSARAHIIGQRAHATEKEVYDCLIKQFGQMRVHREFMFTDDRRTRTDFYVYCTEGNFSVDVFYPKDKYNLAGCLNNKMRTYRGATLQYPVIFLMMNPDIEEIVSRLVENKKNKISRHQRVMTLARFKDFLRGRTPA